MGWWSFCKPARKTRFSALPCMIIRNPKHIALWAGLLVASAATCVYADDPYAGTSKDYQPGQFQRSGADNPIMKDLLSPETYKRRKANYEKWDSLTPQQQEQQRQDRFKNMDFKQPDPVAPIDDGHPRIRTPKSAPPIKPANPNQDAAISNTGIGINREDEQNWQAPANQESYYPPPAADPAAASVLR